MTLRELLDELKEYPLETEVKVWEFTQMGESLQVSLVGVDWVQGEVVLRPGN